MLELFHAFAVPANGLVVTTETEELALAGVDRLAFIEVDLEFQVLLDKAAQAESPTFACPWAFNPNHPVAGVAGKAVTTWLQFPIQGFQHDIGQ